MIFLLILVSTKHATGEWGVAYRTWGRECNGKLHYKEINVSYFVL